MYRTQRTAGQLRTCTNRTVIKLKQIYKKNTLNK